MQHLTFLWANNCHLNDLWGYYKCCGSNRLFCLGKGNWLLSILHLEAVKDVKGIDWKFVIYFILWRSKESWILAVKWAIVIIYWLRFGIKAVK